jgi:hypothetical protein
VIRRCVSNVLVPPRIPRIVNTITARMPIFPSKLYEECDNFFIEWYRVDNIRFYIYRIFDFLRWQIWTFLKIFLRLFLNRLFLNLYLSYRNNVLISIFPLNPRFWHFFTWYPILSKRDIRKLRSRQGFVRVLKRKFDERQKNENLILKLIDVKFVPNILLTFLILENQFPPLILKIRDKLLR